MSDVRCWNCGRTGTIVETARKSGQETQEMQRAKKAKEFKETEKRQEHRPA